MAEPLDHRQRQVRALELRVGVEHHGPPPRGLRDGAEIRLHALLADGEIGFQDGEDGVRAGCHQRLVCSTASCVDVEATRSNDGRCRCSATMISTIRRFCAAAEIGLPRAARGRKPVNAASTRCAMRWRSGPRSPSCHDRRARRGRERRGASFTPAAPTGRPGMNRWWASGATVSGVSGADRWQGAARLRRAGCPLLTASARWMDRLRQ